jgi:hypothetical protein
MKDVGAMVRIMTARLNAENCHRHGLPVSLPGAAGLPPSGPAGFGATFGNRCRLNEL